PVVCGSWGGASELVGSAGVIVTTDKWSYGQEFEEGMVTAVATVLSSLDDYRSRARQRADAEFDIRSVAQEYALAMGLRHAGE
ncbi:MAG: hypothetical protein QGG54_15570, partial [Gammaproteobacteria bacterium]|nr:hypothetical protein [Gammaproteobacteria bacterium]